MCVDSQRLYMHKIFQTLRVDSWKLCMHKIFQTVCVDSRRLYAQDLSNFACRFSKTVYARHLSNFLCRFLKTDLAQDLSFKLCVSKNLHWALHFIPVLVCSHGSDMLFVLIWGTRHHVLNVSWLSISCFLLFAYSFSFFVSCVWLIWGGFVYHFLLLWSCDWFQTDFLCFFPHKDFLFVMLWWHISRVVCFCTCMCVCTCPTQIFCRSVPMCFVLY